MSSHPHAWLADQPTPQPMSAHVRSTSTPSFASAPALCRGGLVSRAARVLGAGVGASGVVGSGDVLAAMDTFHSGVAPCFGAFAIFLEEPRGLRPSGRASASVGARAVAHSSASAAVATCAAWRGVWQWGRRNVIQLCQSGAQWPLLAMHVD